MPNVSADGTILELAGQFVLTYPVLDEGVAALGLPTGYTVEFENNRISKFRGPDGRTSSTLLELLEHTGVDAYPPLLKTPNMIVVDKHKLTSRLAADTAKELGLPTGWKAHATDQGGYCLAPRLISPDGKLVHGYKPLREYLGGALPELLIAGSALSNMLGLPLEAPLVTSESSTPNEPSKAASSSNGKSVSSRASGAESPAAPVTAPAPVTVPAPVTAPAPEPAPEPAPSTAQPSAGSPSAGSQFNELDLEDKIFAMYEQLNQDSALVAEALGLPPGCRVVASVRPNTGRRRFRAKLDDGRWCESLQLVREMYPVLDGASAATPTKKVHPEPTTPAPTPTKTDIVAIVREAFNSANGDQSATGAALGFPNGTRVSTTKSSAESASVDCFTVETAEGARCKTVESVKQAMGGFLPTSFFGRGLPSSITTDEGALLDAALDNLEEGTSWELERREGFVLRPCRRDEATCWAVMPIDTLWVDLAFLAGLVTASGWKCENEGELHCKFVGEVTFVARASRGRLVVLSADEAVAVKLARTLVDSWLASV